jgi:hypothetical protein
LYQFQNGFYQETKFNGNIFIGIYLSHVRSLEKVKKEKPTKFHEFMAKLFDLVVYVFDSFYDQFMFIRVSSTVPAGPGSTADNDAFSIIDL